MSFRRLCKRIVLKCVPHVQHDYFTHSTNEIIVFWRSLLKLCNISPLSFVFISVIFCLLFSGHTFIAVRDGDFLFTYCLWFEDTSGNPVSPQSPLPVLYGAPPTGILSSSFFKYVKQKITCIPLGNLSQRNFLL